MRMSKFRGIVCSLPVLASVQPLYEIQNPLHHSMDHKNNSSLKLILFKTVVLNHDFILIYL